jgi:hypothetical protein
MTPSPLCTRSRTSVQGIILDILYSTLLHLPSFGLHCVGMLRLNPGLRLWQTDALTARPDLIFYSMWKKKIVLKKIHFYRNPIYGKPILTFSNPFLPWPIFEHVCSVILTFESILLSGPPKRIFLNPAVSKAFLLHCPDSWNNFIIRRDHRLRAHSTCMAKETW